MSSELGKEAGFFCAKVEKEEDKKMPPVQGWQYAAGDGKWLSDPTLEASHQVSKPCFEVLVELHGAAREEQSECAGIYRPLKGRHNRGRWVSSFLAIENQSKGIGNVIKQEYFNLFSLLIRQPLQTCLVLIQFADQYQYQRGVEFF